MNHIKIDCETADRITTLTLAQHRDFLVKEVTAALNGKHNLHDSDLGLYTRLIKAFNLLLEQYFEDVPILSDEA